MFKFELHYADVKSFWSNYFAHTQKFWTDSRRERTDLILSLPLKRP
jgi:hypothetical protein